MTPQEVVQRFAAELNANKYSNAKANVGTNVVNVVDDAVRAASNSKFADTNAVIAQLKADQVTAEKLAVEEVLGSSYAGQTMSQVTETILKGDATVDQKALSRGTPVTVRDVIRERKAYIFLEKFCGIQLNDNFFLKSNVTTNDESSNNVDTGAITGSDANLTLRVGDTVNGTELTSTELSNLKTKYGNKATLTGDTLLIGTGATKTAQNILPENGTLKTDAVTSFEVNGLTVHVDNYDSLTDAQKTVVAELKQWWAKKSVDLNEDSYSLGFEDAKISDITLTFDDKATKLATVTPTYRKYSTDDGTVTGLTLTINTAKSGELNRAVANEISRAVVAANVTNFNKLPSFIKEGMAELTHGVDDERGEEIFKLAYTDADLSSALALSTVTDTPTNSDTFAGGYIFMRYFANQAALRTLDDSIAQGDINATVDLSRGNGTYYVTGNNISESAVTSKPTSNEAVSLGSATNNIYTIADTPVKQLVNTGNTARKVTNINGNASVIGSAGNDTLEIVEGTYVNAGAGNNSVSVNAQFATIDAGNGNDSVTVSGGFNTINLGDGANRVSLAAVDYDNSITTGNGNDTVVDASSKLHYNYLVDTGAGNDRVSLNARYSTINTGAGDDTVGFVNSSGTGNFVDLGEGNDSIAIASKNNTVTGSGNNVVATSGGNNVFMFKGGNNTLRGFQSSDSIAVSGNYSVTKVSSNYVIATDFGSINVVGNFNSVNNIITIDGGSPADLGTAIYNSVNNTLVTGTPYDDSIYNTGDYVTVQALDGNNTLTNWGGKYVSITAGAGNDVFDGSVWQSTISTGDGKDKIHSTGSNGTLSIVDAGAGDDTVTGAFWKSKVIGGSGNDFIFDEVSQNLTVSGGSGDDKISLTANAKNTLLEYKNGDGNDTVWGFDGNDTLSISGSAYTSTRTGNGILFNVGNGSVLLVDAAQHLPLNVTNGNSTNVNVTLGNGNETYNTGASNISVTGGTGNDKIKVTGENVSVKPGKGDDTVVSEQPVTVAHASGDGNDTVVASADVFVNLSGTLGNTAQSGNDIILNVGNEKITVKDLPDDAQLTVKDSRGTQTVKAAVTDTETSEPDTTPTDNPNVITLTDFVDTYINTTAGVSIRALDGNDTLTNVAANVSVDGMDGDDKILNSFVPNVTISGGKGDDFLANYGENGSISGGLGNDEIYNYNAGNTIQGGKGDDKISLHGAADKTILQYDASNSEGNDTVWGFTAEDSLVIDNTETYSSLRQGNDLLINVDNGSVLLIDFFGDGRGSSSGTGGNLANISIPASAKDTTPNPLTAELTPQNDVYTNRQDNVTLDALTGNDNLINYGKNISLDAAGGNDSVYNFGQGSTILGNAGDDYIFNTADDVTIDAGADNDSVYNSGSNVTISGGTGNDSVTLTPDAKNVVLEYFSGDGNDTVWGFTNEDSLVAYGNSFHTLKNGDDISVSVDGGTVLLIGAAKLEQFNFGNETPTVTPAETVTNTVPAAKETVGGSDSVNNTGAGAQIDLTGDGNGVENSAPNTTINTGQGDATVDNKKDAAGTRINTGGGNTVVDNAAPNVSIEAGGNDTISNTGDNVSIVTGAAVESIDYYVPEVINNWGDSVTVDAAR